VVIHGCTNVLGQGVVSIDWSQKVARDQFRSLVNELIESMLTCNLSKRC
jgi:hypothetical protein